MTCHVLSCQPLASISRREVCMAGVAPLLCLFPIIPTGKGEDTLEIRTISKEKARFRRKISNLSHSVTHDVLLHFDTLEHPLPPMQRSALAMPSSSLLISGFSRVLCPKFTSIPATVGRTTRREFEYQESQIMPKLR